MAKQGIRHLASCQDMEPIRVKLARRLLRMQTLIPFNREVQV